MSDNTNPGCFGSPLCYAATKVPCSSCMFNAKCGVESEARALRLRARFGMNIFVGKESAKTNKTKVSA